MANHGTTRNRLRLIFLLSTIICCTQAFPLWSADRHRFAAVPPLGVLANGQTGTVHYLVLQLDTDPRREGPTILFNEIHLGGGSAVSEDWKEGVKHAVAAATKAVGEDGREWVITTRTGHTTR